MRKRATLIPAALLAVWLTPGAVAESQPAQRIPIPPSMARAYAAGTRDSSGRPGPRYWQPRHRYQIRARLDPGTARVTGSARITFRNASPTAVSSIVLRLDQNRFRAPTTNAADMPHATDGMNVTQVLVDGQEASIGVVQANRPRLTGTRRTSETLVLSTPIASRDSALLEIEWYFEVPLDTPGSALRMGRFDNRVFQVAQWYPRIAMLDDINWWDTTSYDGQREFYNPFSEFDVELTVPRGWLVGATGVLQNAVEVLSRRTRDRLSLVSGTDRVITIVDSGEVGATASSEWLRWRFVADTVSDFAWGTSAEYVWSAMNVRIPGRSDVPVNLFLTPSNSRGTAHTVEVIRHDLAFNSSLVLPYPFPQLTVLDGPERGMEYPGLLMMNAASPVDHEIWHLWFPMTVGSNETWYAFMDEGFATFLSGVSTAARQNRGYTPPVPRGVQTSAPLVWPDDRGPTDLVTALGYGRTGPIFAALIALAGQDAFFRALKGYAEAWRFRHPSPWDLMFFMSNSLGRNLDAFWYQWLFTTG